MNKQNLDYLKKLNYDDVGRTFAEILRGKAPDLVGGTIAVAYVFYLAKTKGYTDFLYPVQFINDEIEDQIISLYVKDTIAYGWDEIIKLYDKYDKDTLKAYILFGNSLNDKYGTEDSTPDSLCKLAYNLLRIKPQDSVADLGTGKGTFILNSWFECPDAYYYGNEINTGYYSIAYIRSKLMGNKVSIIQEDMFKIKSEKKFYDKIFSNYPFGMRLKDLRSGLDYLEQAKNHYPDITKATSSDWVYNSLIISSLKEDGTAAAIMTNGGTWNSIDKPIREYFVRKGLIKSVIALPEKLFGNTAISTVMIVFSNGNNNIRLVDAREMYIKGRRQNFIDQSNLKKIIEFYTHDSDCSRNITFEELKDNDFVINPIRYFKDNQTVKNGVPFETIIKRITRGAPCSANQLDKMISNKPTKYHYLMLANIKDGIIDKELPYLKDIDLKYEKYCLKDGDIILSKNGFPYKTAVAQFDPERKILANGNLYIIELDKQKARPYYVKAFLESEQGISALNSISVGATIPNIAIEQLKKMMIPLVSLEKQKEIEDSYLSTLDEIELLKFKIDKALGSLKRIFSLEKE